MFAEKADSWSYLVPPESLGSKSRHSFFKNFVKCFLCIAKFDNHFTIGQRKENRVSFDDRDELENQSPLISLYYYNTAN